ncbi:hypothetical protein BMS84_10675, partial [Leuconostoc pseudomesenteroides]
MTEQTVLEKYKGGLSLFKGFKTVELLLDEKNTNEDELYFLGYDANMYPLPGVEICEGDILKDFDENG